MVVMFLANGFEEVEALTPLDLLRRAGAEVVTVAIDGDGNDACLVTGSHGIRVLADSSAEGFTLPANVDMVVLPGGMPGATNLDRSPLVDATLKAAAEQNAYLCAICAAPLVLGKRNYLKGKRATCYPGFEDQLIGATHVSEGVVADGHVITAAGMGIAYPFGLQLVEALFGRARAEDIAKAVMAPLADHE